MTDQPTDEQVEELAKELESASYKVVKGQKWDDLYRRMARYVLEHYSPLEKEPYMPTMDEAYRFMVSNPLTSADMLKSAVADELKALRDAISPGRVGTLFTKEKIRWRIHQLHRILLLLRQILKTCRRMCMPYSVGILRR
jgi:hypothetical protein